MMTLEVMHRTIRAAAATLLLTIALIAPPATSASAKRMQAPGSRVSLDLPEAFKASPIFAGFMEIISSAAVIVQEIPSTEYDRVAQGFTKAALAKKGITKFKKGKLERDGKHLFITGEQKHPRAHFEKFILVMQDTRNTAVLTFNVPKGSFENGSIKRHAVLKALSSARLEDKAAPSRELFKLGYLGPFALTGQATGTTRIFSEKDVTGPKDTRNIVVVAPSLNRLPIRDIKDFSQYALKSLNSVKELTVSKAQDLQIDNMSGHQITATGKRGASATPVTVRQLVLLPANGGYFRLLSVTKQSDEPRLAPEIEKIFQSFKAIEAMQAE